jgi:3-phosphoshikimate 1-carboxyvinyltransferase
MNRVIIPLEMMGARVTAREGGLLPLSIKGPKEALPITYELPVASAQVKSAVLLAGLSAMGKTSVIEKTPTRDHTENMLRAFGVPVEVTNLPNNAGQKISVTGQQDLKACEVHVPSDPSSAAFPTVAALLCKSSEIRMDNILMNERRNGIYTTLIEMGADITFENERIESGEQVADIIVRGNNTLKGIDVPAARVPSMIDEFPILAIAACMAEGTTTMSGLEELRVKESDRLLMMYEGLKACGVTLEMGEDSLTIHGNNKPPQGGCEVKTALDHRIAMSFLVLGTISNEPISIDDSAPIKTSFPNFIELMNGLGAKIK